MARADRETLEALHRELAHALTQRVQSGNATAAEFNVARQLLNDNGVRGETPAVQSLADALASLDLTGLGDGDTDAQAPDSTRTRKKSDSFH